MTSIWASIQQGSIWQEGRKDDTATRLDMFPAPSTASPAMVAEATMAAMVALLSNAAAMAMAAGYAANWRQGNAEDFAAIANAADWRQEDVEDSGAIAMQ